MRQRYILLSLMLLLLATGARAQDTPPVTRTSRILSHFDFGISGIALLTKDVKGTVTGNVAGAPYTFTQSASSAAGAVVTLRGSKSPYKGFEVNYGYGRITQAYTCCNLDVSTGAYIGPFQTQVTANEYTVGYLAKPAHPIFGFQPYVSAGLGTMVFTPTRNGGQGLQKQARATYYYSAGLESLIVGDTLGVRVGVRQNIYLAPDFDQNYLRIKTRTFTTEPQLGLYIHF